MIILLSPAKSLNFETPAPTKEKTQPVFGENANYLNGKLKNLSKNKLGKLMSISAALAELNYERNQNWNANDNAFKQALFSFTGEVYRGLDANSFNATEIKKAQKSIRILSGMYGILKPLDLIQPYRLEMGSKLAITPKTNSLYKYWKDQVTTKLNEELAAAKSNLVVNLASNEYFKVLQPKDINAQLVSCKFMDEKNGELKVRFAYAKLARGFMTRFIIKNNAKTADDLKAFITEGYGFSAALSSPEELVFTR